MLSPGGAGQTRCMAACINEWVCSPEGAAVHAARQHVRAWHMMEHSGMFMQCEGLRKPSRPASMLAPYPSRV